MSFWTFDALRTTLQGAWLSRPRVGGAPPAGVSIDSRTLAKGQVFFAIRGERTDGHRYIAQAAGAGAALAVVDDESAQPAEGWPCPVLRVQDTGHALLRLAGAYRRTLEATKVVAVGGSNGKTTTVRLIVAAAAGTLRGTASVKSFNNAVGVPLTILSASPKDQYLVCEVGTNAPGEILPLAETVAPDIAVITSIGREHLEGLGGIEEVAREELSLLRGLREGGCAIVCADAPVLRDVFRREAHLPPRTSCVRFGFADSADLRITSAIHAGAGVRFTLNGRDTYELPLLGLHNACNAAAAVAAARRLGVPMEAARAGLLSAKGAPMRLEPVEAAGMLFINDAYNANPDSMLAALSVFRDVCRDASLAGRRRVAVLGDMLELGAAGPELHREIGAEIARRGGVDLLITVGELAEHIGPAAGPGCGSVSHVPRADESGVAHAAALLAPGDVVLLKGSRRVALERIIEQASRGANGPQPARPANAART